MSKKKSSSASAAEQVPVVGLREPCPCGSGRRYKACHGREAAHRGERLVARPFEGLTGEADWVAMRELVPAATAPLTLLTPPAVSVTVSTVLPLAWPAMVRASGDIMLGLQVPTGSGDGSRDVAEALERALVAPSGEAVPPVGLPEPGPRLQDLVDPSAPFTVTVHDNFEFWFDAQGISGLDDAMRASLDRASAQANPTVRLASVDAAYWTTYGGKTFLRWVHPQDEDTVLDALARLHAQGSDSVGEGTRFIGSFRACGLMVPVWELSEGTRAEAIEDSAAAYWTRLCEAVAQTSPLTAEERRARSGLLTRQFTLR